MHILKDWNYKWIFFREFWEEVNHECILQTLIHFSISLCFSGKVNACVSFMVTVKFHHAFLSRVSLNWRFEDGGTRVVIFHFSKEKSNLKFIKTLLLMTLLNKLNTKISLSVSSLVYVIGIYKIFRNWILFLLCKNISSDLKWMVLVIICWW